MQRLIVALDTVDLRQAQDWGSQLSPHVGILKLGLEFFLAHGHAGYRALASTPIFLDLKLHDIPNTVAGGVRAVLPLRPKMLTVHAAGGADMIGAAAAMAATAGADKPLILAVTVLTSLDQDMLRSMGVEVPLAEQVVRLGKLAVAAGADGLVCSPHEVALLRQELGPDVKLVVPGIRPTGGHVQDQARVMSPRQAIEAGADWVVIGRPITGSRNPVEAAAEIVRSIQ
jgi:orotidine-5'-phosphate decarboxylase